MCPPQLTLLADAQQMLRRGLRKQEQSKRQGVGLVAHAHVASHICCRHSWHCHDMLFATNATAMRKRCMCSRVRSEIFWCLRILLFSRACFQQSVRSRTAPVTNCPVASAVQTHSAAAGARRPWRHERRGGSPATLALASSLAHMPFAALCALAPCLRLTVSLRHRCASLWQARERRSEGRGEGLVTLELVCWSICFQMQRCGKQGEHERFLRRKVRPFTHAHASSLAHNSSNL